MASIDFNTINKQCLTVTLNDEYKTTLSIYNPTKKLLSEIIAIDSLVRESGENGEKDIEALYEVCAKILSRNKNRKIITKDLLEEIFDTEDIIILLKTYMEFISAQTKN